MAFPGLEGAPIGTGCSEKLVQGMLQEQIMPQATLQLLGNEVGLGGGGRQLVGAGVDQLVLRLTLAGVRFVVTGELMGASVVGQGQDLHGVLEGVFRA